jgi:hypothetical protein
MGSASPNDTQGRGYPVSAHWERNHADRWASMSDPSASAAMAGLAVDRVESDAFRSRVVHA